MIKRSKIFRVTGLVILALIGTDVNATEFFIAAGSRIPGFSTNSECEADGYGSGGCAQFGLKKDCGGYTIYVGNSAHRQMSNEYNQGEKITIRHLNADGSFGYIICTYN